MQILVTGGCGFIGSAVVRRAIRDGHGVVNVDALTYAANPANVAEAAQAPGYRFEHADIRNPDALKRIFADHRPDAVMHLAAESHVDRSIDGPAAFIETNITGTYQMLRRPGATGPAWTRPPRRPSASTTSPPTRSTARSEPRGSSSRRRPTARARPTRPPRRPRTTWSAPGARPMGCRS